LNKEWKLARVCNFINSDLLPLKISAVWACAVVSVGTGIVPNNRKRGEKMLVVNEATRHLFRDWWHKQQARNTKHLKVMALFLPQFYATEYHDLWWGAGYREWSALASWEKFSEA
jgi:hypothetical protein